MHNEKFLALKVFVSELVDEINVDANQSNVALITFSDQPDIQIELDRFHVRKELKDAILGVNYQMGGTNTADALQMACSQIYK